MDFEDDEQPVTANEAEERLQQVLGHAALHLMTMPDAKADSIRRFLRDEVASDPALARDSDRVGRLVERVSKAIDTNGANGVQAAPELRGIRA